LLGRIADATGEPAAFALLRGLAEGQSRSRAQLLTWTRPPPGALREALGRIDRVRAAAAAATKDDRRPAWLRGLAFDVALNTHDPAAPALLAALIDPEEPAELQAAAARGLARLADPELMGDVLGRWDRLALSIRRVALASFVTEATSAARLLDAVEQGTVGATEIDPAAREALHRLRNPALLARLGRILRRLPPDDRKAVVDRYRPALDLDADPAQRRTLFERHCQTCHAREGRGAKVGPDLISVAGRPKDDLLVAILDPSREVAPDGLGVVVVTTRGRTLTGLLAEETQAAIRLRRAEGLDDVIPRDEIESLRPTGRSLMPDGLEQVLDFQDVADLIAFRSPIPETPPDGTRPAAPPRPTRYISPFVRPARRIGPGPDWSAGAGTASAPGPPGP
jgi:putative heme-binding domain-containing protein